MYVVWYVKILEKLKKKREKRKSRIAFLPFILPHTAYSIQYDQWWLAVVDCWRSFAYMSSASRHSVYVIPFGVLAPSTPCAAWILPTWSPQLQSSKNSILVKSVPLSRWILLKCVRLSDPSCTQPDVLLSFIIPHVQCYRTTLVSLAKAYIFINIISHIIIYINI